jgi:hypothetical protein
VSENILNEIKENEKIMGFGNVKIYGRIEFEEINWEVIMV